MNVVYASDDGYVSYLGVSLFSLLKNNRDDFDEIKIFILDNGIKLENKEKLEKLCLKFDSKIYFYDVGEIEKNLGLSIKSNLHLAAYSRLFISSFLDDDISKVIYLDSDSLVVGSFKEIWNCDISDYYCAGVLDTTLPFYKKSIGLSNDDDYVNSGFLLINLEKWRLDNIEDKFIQFLIDYNGEVVHNDQGIINGVLNGKILIVNPRYNLLSTFYEMSYEDVKKWYGLDNYYSKEIISYSKKNPVFIHFVNFLNGRPWFNDKHPLYEKYKEYVLISPFKDSVYIDDNRPFKFKFLSFLYKILPFGISHFLYKLYLKFFINYF